MMQGSPGPSLPVKAGLIGLIAVGTVCAATWRMTAYAINRTPGNYAVETATPADPYAGASNDFATPSNEAASSTSVTLKTTPSNAGNSSHSSTLHKNKSL